jgi:hypothetical protein
MKGRVAQIKLSEEQLARLHAGGRITVRLPKNVAQLRISAQEGHVFREINTLLDKFWKDFDRLWKKLPFRK